MRVTVHVLHYYHFRSIWTLWVQRWMQLLYYYFSSIWTFWVRRWMLSFFFSSIWTLWVQWRLDNGCYYFTCIWITELDNGYDYYHYTIVIVPAFAWTTTCINLFWTKICLRPEEESLLGNFGSYFLTRFFSDRNLYIFLIEIIIRG